MLREKLVHVNSKGDVLDLDSLRISTYSSNLRDYEWSYESRNNQITRFTKKIAKRNVVFTFHCNKLKAIEIKNKFYEHFDVDVLNKKYGYFLLNGYKYYCYLIKSVKSNYNVVKRYLELKIEVVTDKDYWFKENTKEINFSKVNINDSLVYEFVYPFTYGSMNTVLFNNDSFVESDAIIRIFGQCENPLVTINDKVYQVNVSLDEGEYLEIDTENKTIYKFSIYGDKVNYFNYRNKKYNVFDKIPSGTVNVSANGEFKVDIVIIEKRSEPKWS